MRSSPDYIRPAADDIGVAQSCQGKTALVCCQRSIAMEFRALPISNRQNPAIHTIMGVRPPTFDTHGFLPVYATSRVESVQNGHLCQ